MDNVFVYCETEGTQVAEVSQELLTKGRKLADELGVELHAIAAGDGLKGQVEAQILASVTPLPFSLINSSGIVRSYIMTSSISTRNGSTL